MNRIMVFIMCALLLAACGGGKEEKHDALSATQIKAAELSEKANEAYAKGAYELALRYYREALRLSRSVEDFDSMAIGVINTASALRATGKLDEADILVDDLLRSSYLQLSDGMKAEARYLKALILLDMTDAAGAVAQADIALKACNNSCDALARIYNLSARAYLKAENTEVAREQAQAGWSTSQRDNDGREEANALRILGEVDEAQSSYQGAAKHYEQALEMDKKLALGSKIYLDLMGLGRVAAQLGETDKADEYFRRAQSVAEALGDEDKAGQAKRGLESLHKKQ